MNQAAAWPERLSRFARDLAGWRRRRVALALGVAAAGALPPYHLVLLLIPALAGLMWLAVAQARPRDAFAVGLWWGVGHCAAAYYWISHSLTVDAARHAWLIPVAVIGFAVVLGLFPALVAAALNGLRRWRGLGPEAPPGLSTALLFAGLWALAEWLRGWVFTGFPWNPLGSVWTFIDPMFQAAAVLGVYGLGLVTVLAAVLAVSPGGKAGRAVRGPVLTVALLIGLYGYGVLRLDGVITELAEGVTLRLVQPNIAQKDKWTRGLRAGHVARQIAMSTQPPEPGRPSPSHIIWAETATPYILASDPGLVRELAATAPRAGVLVTGTLRAEGRPGTEGFRVYNALQAVEPSGRIAASYDKFHLVPFGEYVPFYDWLSFLKITVGRGNFAAGPGLRVLDLKGLPPVTPLICYEVIFPGAAVPPEGPRPEWLLNITNDGWFGLSAGPHQHYAAARLRAVEEGLPLVRVANTGISAVVDPWGRERAALDLGLADVVDSGLPRPLDDLTPFARWGNALPLSLAVIGLLLGLAGLARSGRVPPERVGDGA